VERSLHELLVWPPNVTANFSVWYTNVAKAVYPAVKGVRPDVKVLGTFIGCVEKSAVS
jgi:hypothetical protein